MRYYDIVELLMKTNMKQREENKKYSEEFQEDENLTFGQDETTEDTELNDNLSDDEEIVDDPVVNEEETLQEKYDELNNSHLRLHAEFDNYRKRTLKEKMEIIKAGGERVLTDMIPLIDDFERALDVVHQSDNKEAIVEGLELIYSKFISFLNLNGVKEVEAIGQPFDADKFEAITTIPAADKSQKDMVVDCIQKGYILNDKVLRFPKVIVGK